MLTFANAAILAGLAAVVIPPIIHFFSRRRIDETDWAAMQFLQVSRKTRRKVYFEQVLLMLLRMLIIAVLVMALAAPVVTSSLFSRFGFSGGSRDFVILIDGSSSMSIQENSQSAADTAKQWTAAFLESLKPGDRVAIYQARQQMTPLLATFNGDLEQAKNSLELLPPPRGSVDWPGCVAAAAKMLESARPERDIVIVSDLQRSGWADETTLARWELRSHAGPRQPRIWVVDVAAGRDAEPFNIALEPIVAARGVATVDREVRFRSALRTTGKRSGNEPISVKLEVDGSPLGEVKIDGTPVDPTRVINFSQRFSAGSHLVTLRCEGDDFTADNRQDFALEVLPAVPVLIVDGSGDRRAEFLRDALAPAKDPSPSFLTKIVAPGDFTPGLLASDIRGAGTPPRVLVLSNVAILASDQNAAVEKFLAEGGSVLVTLGDRINAEAWNRVCFRAGQGWLPARLVGVAAGEVKPLPESFAHPAVEVFKEPLPGGLHTAVFNERWKLDLAAGINGVTGTVIARLADREPMIVERGIGRGRVAMSTVPLDNSWGTNLVVLPDFVRLVHELLYYLAGARAAERNLAPGQAIIFVPRPMEAPAGVTVHSPDDASRTVPVNTWPLVYDGTRDAGAYRLSTAGGRTFYYAVRNDVQESVLTPCSAEDRKTVADLVPELQYVNSTNDMAASLTDGPQSREIWVLMVVLMAMFLIFEIIFTRRLAVRSEQ